MCKKIQYFLLLLPLLFFVSCLGETPSTPLNERSLVTPHVTPELKIISPGVVTLTRDTSLTFAVQFRESTGRLISRSPETLQWSTSVPNKVSVSPMGLITAGPELGATYLIVQSSDGFRDSILLWIQPPANEPSQFKITFIYADNLPAHWRAALDSAALRWEEVIRGELPEAMLNITDSSCATAAITQPPPTILRTERGVTIYAGVATDMRPSLNMGVPCVQRAYPHPTTLFGTISITPELVGLTASPIRFLAMRSIGAALGLPAAIFQQVEWFDISRGVTKGMFTLEGYRRYFNVKVDSLQLRNTAWPFGGDVVSSIPDYNLITEVSVGALMDLGYPAAWYGAGSY